MSQLHLKTKIKVDPQGATLITNVIQGGYFDNQCKSIVKKPEIKVAPFEIKVASFLIKVAPFLSEACLFDHCVGTKQCRDMKFFKDIEKGFSYLPTKFQVSTPNTFAIMVE